MSSLINPVGPEEPSTYWRRRAIIVVVVIVLLWLLWFVVRAVTGDDESPSAPASPTPTPTASSQAQDEAEQSPQAAGEAAGAQVSQAAVVQPCDDGAIEVSVEVPQATTVGSGATATMTVANTGSRPCLRDLGAGANEVRITSGSALVWSSDFCGASDAADEKVLQPGARWSTEISWPGRVTTSDCPQDQPTAQPGGYRAVARNGQVQSQAALLAVR